MQLPPLDYQIFFHIIRGTAPQAKPAALLPPFHGAAIPDVQKGTTHLAFAAACWQALNGMFKSSTFRLPAGYHVLPIIRGSAATVT